MVSAVLEEPEVFGQQMPRFWTAPDRHREEVATCPSCGITDDGYSGIGCGDYLSTEILDWSKGFGYKPDPWQEWVIREACGTRPDGRWSSFENDLIVSRQNGKGTILEMRELAGMYLLGEKLIIHTAHELKGLSDDTSVLTFNRGWTTMGALQSGDLVYAPDGTPTRVTETAHHSNKACYRVIFADGQEVTADEDHHWQVTEAWLHNGKTERKVVTTRQMLEAGLVHSSRGSRNSRARKVYRWRTGIPEPVQMPEAKLSVNPWLLGAWLGDGTSARGCLTVGEEDLPYVLGKITDGGDSTTSVTEGRHGVWTVRIAGLTTRLRELGLLGKKSIPADYKLSSVEQRRELLAGIMDTDGTVSGHQLVVSMNREALMRQVLSLTRSLGYRATFGSHMSKLNGKPCGLVYSVRFAPNGTSPFSMPRKTARIKSLKHSRSLYNAITGIEPVESVNTSCITVAHPSSCYLAGRGFFITHNTAQEHFLRVIQTIENYPALSRRMKGKPRFSHGEEQIQLIAKPTLIFGSGRKRIFQSVSPRLRFLARSRGSARGFTCNCLIYDEAMILSAESVGASLPTMSAVPNSQMWLCGSAGMEDSEQLARSRRRITHDTKDLFGAEWSIRPHLPTCKVDRANGRLTNNYVVCDEHDDRDTPESAAKANPAFGYRLTWDFTKNELATLSVTEYDRERLGVGQWPAEEEAWRVVGEDLFRSLTQRPERDKGNGQYAFALDVAEDSTSASIAICWAHRDGYLMTEIPKDCARAGTNWVVKRLEQLVHKYKPLAIVAPRTGPAAGLGDDLEKLWPKHHKFGSKLIRSSASDDAAAFAWFVQQCKDGNRPLRHVGEKAGYSLWHAVGTAETRVMGDGGMTWCRRDSTTDITPAVACNLAAWGLNKKRRDYDLLKSIG